MSSAAAMTANRARLRVAIVSGEPSRVSMLAGIVLNAGHDIANDGDDADVVISDGSIQHLDHPAVIKLCDIDDHETASALPKSATAEQICAAIQAVAVGLSVRLRSTKSHGFGAASEVRSELLLTPREIEVLEALAEGLSNKGVARKLDISQHTVKFHIESLFRKLGVRSRSQAVIRGLPSLSRMRL
jgi:ATP/maltotriose-dependent transcriptional regulator MalT